ncbi:MAG: hypothetical protein ABL983_00025 [Nitrospira sp.]|jgi:hypothetical protein
MPIHTRRPRQTPARRTRPQVTPPSLRICVTTLEQRLTAVYAIAAFGLDHLEQRANDGHRGAQTNYEVALAALTHCQAAFLTVSTHPALSSPPSSADIPTLPQR